MLQRRRRRRKERYIDALASEQADNNGGENMIKGRAIRGGSVQCSIERETCEIDGCDD